MAERSEFELSVPFLNCQTTASCSTLRRVALIVRTWSNRSGSLALDAARDVAHVLAHHVGRAQPDEDFEADETD